MNRRSFLETSVRALAAAGLGPVLSCSSDTLADRLAMTTVTFMSRFSQTGKPATGTGLKLLDIPAYFAERFQVRNLEFWSRHFASTEDDELQALRAEILRHDARLINIQLDGPYDLSDTDADRCQTSLQFARQWIDIARSVGSQGLRLNPGRHDVRQCIRSLRELSWYAAEREVVLYVENHGGLGTNPDNVLQIYRRVSHPYVKILTDFANFAPEYDQLESIGRLIRHSGLVSAKALHFDAGGRHPDYDFDACVRTCEAAGYEGRYSAEYYDPHKRQADPEFVADHMLARLRAVLAA